MARTRRSISWLHVRPRTVHNSRSVGTLDVFGDVKYRASAMAIEELETVYDSNTDTEIPELSTNINRDNVWNSPGLNDEGVALAAKHFGLNDLQIPSPQSTFWRYCRLLMHPYHVCLIIAGVLLLIAYGLEQRSQENLALFFVLWILVAVTSCLGMESGTPNRLSSKFRALRPSHARVIRNGEEAVVVADTLYPGDLVRLIKGESIPADIRILSVNADQSFTVSERTLTGNINPLVKVSTVMPIVLPARKCPNIVLQGSTVLSGEALGVVVGTGRRTVLGRVYDIVGNKLAFEAPIEGDLQRMITELTAWTVIWALVVFLIGVISDKTVRQHTLLFTAGVLVACIPEGMILTIMISLAWTSAKMKKQGLIVPNLETAETLGMIDTLCCDRTVFTSNKLKVGEVWYSGNCVTDFNIRDAGLRVLVDTVTLSSKAQWVVNARTRSANQVARNDPPEVHGDYIDVACLRFCDELYKSIGTCSARVRESNPCVGEVPLLPRNNWTLQVHHSRNKREDRGFLKGAFERIRKMSDYILIDGEEVPMQQSHILEITTSANAMAKRGFRILGLAQLVLPTEHYPPSVDRTKENSNYSSIETDDAESLFRDDNVRIVFVGLLGIDDPPVPGVANAVSRCRRAGIKIVVTTGEHGWCTESFGRQIGLITGVTTEQFLEKKFGWHTVQSWTYDDFVREEADLTPEEQQQISARIIPGHIIERWNLVNMDENWKRAIETDEVIFSRCTPAQKKIIAHHYKLTGHVVGVTGSDLHDGAALKEADVGFCCGQGIVQAIREAADVICLENNFVAMVRGIAEGRTIFDNLKKSIAYCLTSNMPQLIAFLLFAIIRIPAPLTVTLCLCIDIGTDFFAGLSLGLENQEQDLMEQDPPAPTDGVYNRNVLQWSYFQIGIIESLGAIYTFFVVMHAEGYPAQDLWFSAWRNFHLNAAPFNHYSVVENIHALKHAQTAYFGAIVIQQLAVHLIVRTRRQSLFASQNSWATHFSWVLSMVLTTFIVYTPVVHNIFGTTYLPFLYWLPSIPWALFIIEYEELRKLLLRNVSNISLQRIISW